ncbi:MAG TPA: cell envelope integrity protein CreD [Steroidobacteraceae bacterium]|nr:cell envelope integrity protein CreD [Steroidobacteraceae bacterium]
MAELRRFFPPLLLKALTIGGVTILLLILIAQVEDVVNERVGARATALARVAESWGGAQTTGGVLLEIPVETTRVVYGNTTRVERRLFYILPDTLDVKAGADPSYRTVGLYSAPVYTANVSVSGQFIARDFTPPPGAGEPRWNEARLLVLNSESRSLRAVDGLRIGAESPPIAADNYAGMAGVSAGLPADVQSGGVIPFSFRLTLAGSDRLTFLPLARKAQIDLQSAWPHPKFEGAPAPLQPQIGAGGFSARWSVLEINRNFGQTWFDTEVKPNETAIAALAASGVGVTFYEPVDIYQRNYRAVHYAVLLIAITFLTFLLWEQLAGIAIHGVQYLMVGLALALFYLLLLALSEHVAFDVAYAVSAGALVALITTYLTGVLKRWSLSLGAGAGLATLYALLYWILRSEDYSLLMGALLLFGVLAVLMIATRKVDWTRAGRRSEESGSLR